MDMFLSLLKASFPFTLHLMHRGKTGIDSAPAVLWGRTHFQLGHRSPGELLVK